MGTTWISPDGPPIRNGGDALGLIYESGAEEGAWIAIPVERLDPQFFDLSSGIAGDVVQKFVNYRSKLAVVGDISDHTAASNSLRDFIRESNRGNQIWFVTDAAELESRLR